MGCPADSHSADPLLKADEILDPLSTKRVGSGTYDLEYPPREGLAVLAPTDCEPAIRSVVDPGNPVDDYKGMDSIMRCAAPFE